MNATAETLIVPPVNAAVADADAGSDRRADVEKKQIRIAGLLKEAGCDGLLVMEPENFAYLTSGAAARAVLDPRALPALYFSADQRWVIASNVDSQRLFDEELDGLGFQLKEWPWHWERDQLLADLCHGRTVACDRAFGSCKPVGDQLCVLRRALTPYEQACCFALGSIVSHALEATCRTMSPKETEREIAGQLSHRLLHRGTNPLVVEVAADGRSRRYRQCGFTSLPINHYCVLTISARKYGLCATASRSVCFGQPDPLILKEHDAACKVSATYIASSWPDAMPRQILSTGRHLYRLIGFEHEWRYCPQGHITGRSPVELNLTPRTDQLFHPDWAVTWHASAGAAVSCDTFLITDAGPQLVTPAEMWPLKRIRVQGAEFFRPDLLIR
jgi:Xaa-Pro aminopeptidase